jgi:hypothetical protein
MTENKTALFLCAHNPAGFHQVRAEITHGTDRTFGGLHA